jgi:hypothetical protein
VIGTNRGLLAGVASFDTRKVASIRIMKISASIVVLPGVGTTLALSAAVGRGFNLRAAFGVSP